MAYALCPDNGPPRLWRRVSLHEAVAPPHEDMITYLDGATNTLVIVEERFYELPWIDQHRILRTHAPLTIIDGSTYREVWK